MSNNLTETDILLRDNFGIDERIIKLTKEVEGTLKKEYERLNDVTSFCQYKVLAAFQKNRISDMHFAWNTGYGYDDAGRDAVEKVFSDVFNTEAALVRTTIVNGTHALSLAIGGVLRPGDELIYASGAPYDTLEEVIGTRGSGMGSLIEYGITYKQIELNEENKLDLEKLKKSITANTKMVSVQRATGYAWRKAITIDEIKEFVDVVKNINPNIICMVDNCYGEFLDSMEPTDVGVDIMAGSLIKNPGGGLALTGGYIVGKKELIQKVGYRMTCPGIGSECGLTFGQTRSILQGLFTAPNVVNGALKGALLCGGVYEKLGYEICPKIEDKRSDIIQAVKLKSPEAVVAFCEGIQAAAPIDSYVKPEPWDMPGYVDKVVMAAGAFVQGSSIELSADAPIREPYIVYFQGGLTYDHSKFGVIKSLQQLVDKNLLTL